jgi:hypothetical protein
MVPSRKLGIPTKPARALSSQFNQGRAGPGPAIRKAVVPSPASLRLRTADGARKYVTAGERDTFLQESERGDQLGPVVNWLILAGGREPHVGWWDW